MYSDRYIFKKARFVALHAGYIVPLLEMDPFSISEKTVELEEGVCLDWMKCLAADEHGKIHEVEQIQIHASEAEDYVETEELVFSAIITDRGSVETFCFTPGDWINSIENVASSIGINY